MIRTLLKIGAGLLIVIAVYAAVLASEWLPRPDAAEVAALATLQAPVQPVDGPNAYAVIWFLYQDLEGRDPDESMRKHVGQLHELVVANRADEFSSREFDAPGTERLTFEEFCPPAPASCLDHVRSLSDHGASVLAPRAALLDRLDALHAATHLTYPFRLDDPLQVAPFAGTMHVMRMAAARRFVDGDRSGGLSLACRDLATWRRLAPTSDILIHGMIAIAWIDAHAGLVSEMLAEWPANDPLPTHCDDALSAPSAAERDQCPVWQGEFRYLQARLDRPYSEMRKEFKGDRQWLPSFAGDLLFNSRAQVARSAVDYATGCADHTGSTAGGAVTLDWMFDPAGTAMRELNGPLDHSTYIERFADHLDFIHAVRLQAWLRDKPELDAAMADLPPDLVAVPDTLDVDAESRTLTLYLRQAQADDVRTFELPPLPTPRDSQSR